MPNRNILDYHVLKLLAQTYGPSGNERQVAEFISQQVGSYVQDIRSDALGNLLIRKPGTGKKILIACHMDEIGVIITSIGEEGYLYFAPVGGVKSSDLLAKRVQFQNKRIGVVSQEKNTVDEEKTSGKYFIDIGVNSQEEAGKIVREGDMAVLVGDYQETADHILSKALDDRIGCFIAVEMIKQLHSEQDLYFAFTAQEEVGSRGAKTIVHGIEPDLALILDTTLSFDSPKEKNRTSLNRGAAIKVMDRTIVVSPRIKNWMADAASQNDISFQWEIITTGGTDSGPIHLTGRGIPTGGIAIPVRYLHTGNEIAAKHDILSAFLLLAVLLNQPFTNL
ncbi:MAG: putative aminopeptidase YsdC [Candidatus Dichloromethanomonas elyunquensis]|nr:MAG: putative aminopeptidase YsdC [Candidatus Dichloromethanomonas elyunquensis]